jgi:hypothetical protein
VEVGLLFSPKVTGANTDTFGTMDFHFNLSIASFGSFGY